MKTMKFINMMCIFMESIAVKQYDNRFLICYPDIIRYDSPDTLEKMIGTDVNKTHSPA